jgi:CHAD domain-containing protein
VERRELLFAASGDPGQVFAALSARYAVHAEPANMSSWTYLDTVDWRLHRTGMTLRDTRRGSAGELVLSTDTWERIAVPSRVRSWPRRVEALPTSTVRERIAPAVGVRALLPLAQMNVRSMPLRLTDDSDKTRVRVRVDQQRLGGSGSQPLPLRVLVVPLRGYERDADRCADLLIESMPHLDTRDTMATIAMTAAGYSPGQPAVPKLVLDPTAPAAESVSYVLRRWMDIIDAARPGVLDDLDPEYLHELRTAVRAIRSILRLAGAQLPETQAARFAAEFAWFGRLTTPLRDIDVYLLELAGRGAVDVSDLDGLAPLRQHLARRRTNALRTLRSDLRSARGERLSADWRRTLDALGALRVGGPSTREIAAIHAQTAYRRIRNAAAPVTAQTPADELHRLRRRCKRMRYLLDSYESVYEPQPHRAVLSALKKLQDCLGDIQDSDVQRGHLLDIAATLAGRGAPVTTVLEMGALRDRTSARDDAARHDLTRRLQRFTAPAMRTHVRALTTCES